MSSGNPGHPNLGPPFKAGENHNPTGRNQYTARSEAAKAWDALALEVKGDKRRLDEFLENVWVEARGGKEWAAKALLDRLVPIVKEIDHRIHDERDPVKVPATDERIGAVAELLAETVH